MKHLSAVCHDNWDFCCPTFKYCDLMGGRCQICSLPRGHRGEDRTRVINSCWTRQKQMSFRQALFMRVPQIYTTQRHTERDTHACTHAYTRTCTHKHEHMHCTSTEPVCGGLPVRALASSAGCKLYLETTQSSPGNEAEETGCKDQRQH